MELLGISGGIVSFNRGVDLVAQAESLWRIKHPDFLICTHLYISSSRLDTHLERERVCAHLMARTLVVHEGREAWYGGSYLKAWQLAQSTNRRRAPPMCACKAEVQRGTDSKGCRVELLATASCSSVCTHHVSSCLYGSQSLGPRALGQVKTMQEHPK
eukprot:1482702-Amphidinium_carterae.2